MTQDVGDEDTWAPLIASTMERHARLDVPPTNTPEVAAAVGMPPYRVKGALFVLPTANGHLMLDLLEWQEPTDPTPPYPHLYPLGIARIALSTDDLDGDMARLEQNGVELLAAPASVTLEGQPTTRFVCFEDPDGTIPELVETGGA